MIFLAFDKRKRLLYWVLKTFGYCPEVLSDGIFDSKIKDSWRCTWWN
jgi:hypothetical protein